MVDLNLEAFGPVIGYIVITFILGFIFTRIYFRFIRKASFLIRNDPTNYKFLGHFITGVIYIVGIGLALSKIDGFSKISASLLTGAGILAAAVALASQHALSNIISGIALVIFKPFRVNDHVILKNGTIGIVEDITLRHTVIRDLENKRIIIPNTVISNESIINADIREEAVMRFVEIGISYDSDIDLAKKIMWDEIFKHPAFLNRAQFSDDPKQQIPIRVISLGDSSVTLRAWVWGREFMEAMFMEFDLLESIKKRFDKEGITIPFPQRTVHLHDVNKK